MSPYQVRLALKAAGFSPIPCKGKRPLLEGWQHKLDASDEEMRCWQGRNTGMLCNYNPASDADITEPEAVDAVEGGGLWPHPIAIRTTPDNTTPTRTFRTAMLTPIPSPRTPQLTV